MDLAEDLQSAMEACQDKLRHLSWDQSQIGHTFTLFVLFSLRQLRVKAFTEFEVGSARFSCLITTERCRPDHFTVHEVNDVA